MIDIASAARFIAGCEKPDEVREIRVPRRINTPEFPYPYMEYDTITTGALAKELANRLAELQVDNAMFEEEVRHLLWDLRYVVRLLETHCSEEYCRAGQLLRERVRRVTNAISTVV